MDGRSRYQMLELRRVSAGSSRYVRSQILLGGASKTGKRDEYCRKSFIENVQVAVIGCKGPFAFPKLKASVSMGAAGAFCFCSIQPVHLMSVACRLRGAIV